MAPARAPSISNERKKTTPKGGSISREGPLNCGNVGRRRQCQHQQNAGFLRAQILAGDDPALAQTAPRGDPAAGGAAALHDNDPGLGRALECSALLLGRTTWREACRDDSAGAGG